MLGVMNATRILRRLVAGKILILISCTLCHAQHRQDHEVEQILRSWNETSSKVRSAYFEFEARQVPKVYRSKVKTADDKRFTEDDKLVFICKLYFEGTKMRFEKEGLFWNTAQKRFVYDKHVYTWNGETGVESFSAGEPPEHRYAIITNRNSFVEQTITPLLRIFRMNEPSWQNGSALSLVSDIGYPRWEILPANQSASLLKLSLRPLRGTTVECILDRSKDFSLIQYVSKSKSSNFRYSLSYELDREHKVWVPRRWSSTGRKHPYVDEISVVKNYVLNDAIDASVFESDLPTHTVVTDTRYRDTPRENYLLKSNGEKRYITRDDHSKPWKELINSPPSP